jgi:hypothetical protein
MFLFDLQTVAFLVLKKARCIAAIHHGRCPFLWAWQPDIVETKLKLIRGSKNVSADGYT